MNSKIEEDLTGAGGKKSKKKLDKLGFKPQIDLKKMPHILQSSKEGCPTACAVMLLNYKSIKVSYRELQKKVFNWKRMDETQLRQVIESYGIKTIPVKSLEEAKKIVQNGKPVCVLVDRSIYSKGRIHWIVLRGYKENTFIGSDPADKQLRRLESKTLDAAIKSSRVKILFTLQ
ncbi:MAG: C39 family peptidase [Methanosarcinales archaeon]